MRCGTQDLGVGTRTLVAMITAETLGLPVGAVKAEIGDSNYPFSGGSGGSTTAPSVSPAIRVTASLALEALAARIAPTLGVPADQVTAADGRVFAKNDTSKGLSWKEACKLLGTEPVSVNGEWQPGLSRQRHERRADRRGRGGHRDRHHARHADHLRAGLRPRRQPDAPPRARSTAASSAASATRCSRTASSTGTPRGW